MAHHCRPSGQRAQALEILLLRRPLWVLVLLLLLLPVLPVLMATDHPRGRDQR